MSTFSYMEYSDMDYDSSTVIDGQRYIGEGRYNDFYFVTTENAVTGEPSVGLIPPSPYSGDTPLPKDVKPLLRGIVKEVLFWKLAKQRNKEEA